MSYGPTANLPCTDAQRGTIPGSTWNDSVPLYSSRHEAEKACLGRPSVHQFVRWEHLESVLREIPDEQCASVSTPYMPNVFSPKTQERVRRVCDPFKCRAPRDNASLIASARWALDYARSAVVVCRRGSSLWFLPFCNRQFVNLWSTGVVRDHLDAYVRAFRPDSARWLSPCKLWSNGTMLCTHAPEGQHAMADRGFSAWLHMLQHVCRVHGDTVSDFTVFLNKRDAPLLRTGWRLGAALYDPFEVSRNTPMPPSDFPAVLSAYANWLQADDIAIPSPSHWASACSSGTHPALRPLEDPPYACVTPWENRQNRAVFRGSLTSPERRDLVLGADPNVLDAQCTGLGNHRLKVERHNGALRVAPPVTDVCARGGAFLSMQDMFSRYRYVVTCDGHGAADRELEYLKSSGCVVLKYEPCVSGKSQWYDAVIFEDAGSDNDPIVRCRTMRSLQETIVAMQRNPQMALGFAACASAFGHRWLNSGAMSEYVALVLTELAPVFGTC